MKELTPFQQKRGRERCYSWSGSFGCSLLVLVTMITLSCDLLAQDCGGTSTGLIPLTDLGTQSYQGSQGGLYPDGSNVMSQDRLKAGLAFLKQIQPLNSAGQPDQNGKIVLISMGMSNTQQEFTPFIPLALADPEINPNLVIVNGAKATQDASKWSVVNGQAWQNLASQISAAGVTNLQVQAAWLLNAMPATLGPQTFPERAQWLKDFLKTGIRNLKDSYPNVRVVYLSSRIYAGYATTNLSPEPFAYEGGFAMKWLIEDQINGDPELSYDGANPEAPWLAWGPYLWANGLGSDNVSGGIPGRSDGLEWECGDYQNDGTHPNPRTGAPKVAQLILDFFKTDSTATTWFLNNTITHVELTSFEVNVRETNVVLRWQSSNELNNAGFEIQRQSNQSDFETIAFIQPDRSTNSGQNYEFTDKELPPDLYTYRLKQIDIDGTIQFSKEISVQIETPKEFKLAPSYPNPFRKNVNLVLQTSERAFLSIRIYNILGQEITRLISEEREAGAYTIQWNGLDRQQRQVAHGIYFVTLWRQSSGGSEQLVGKQKILFVR